jgi:hypothetical protein
MKRLIALAAVVVVAALLPGEVEAVATCADNGTCCPEERSLCVWSPNDFLMNYYWHGPGSCKSPPGDM